MPTNRQVKRKAQSFSLTAEEKAQFLDRARKHGYKRTEYLLALMEAADALSLQPTLDANYNKVLRPGPAFILGELHKTERETSEAAGGDSDSAQEPAPFSPKVKPSSPGKIQPRKS